MTKYNKKLVFMYINGLEINDCLLQKLENTPGFMKEVITKTNDKKMYFLCSDNLKKNCSFVKFLILKYRDDKKFICKVADYYLKNVNSVFEKTEIAVIMANLMSGVDKYNKYELISSSQYFQFLKEIDTIKNNDNVDNNVKQDLGLGFKIILERFNNNEYVLDYYAKRFIFGIFYKNINNLEMLLHESFSDNSEINVYGPDRFIIDFISKFDCSLALYAKKNPKLIKNVYTLIQSYINNWVYYEQLNEEIKYEELNDRIMNFWYNSNDLSVDKNEILIRASKELGIYNKVNDYLLSYIRENNEQSKECSDYNEHDINEKEITEEDLESLRRYIDDIKEIMKQTVLDENNANKRFMKK